MLKYLKTALGVVVLLSAPLAGASAQSGDGKNRWVAIQNISTSRAVVRLYAVPSHFNAPEIVGQDLIPNVIIRPGQAYSVNFDDGRGTCYFDVRGTSQSAGYDWVIRNFNVCAESRLNLRG
jgi:hypothetical protein